MFFFAAMDSNWFQAIALNVAVSHQWEIWGGEHTALSVHLSWRSQWKCIFFLSKCSRGLRGVFHMALLFCFPLAGTPSLCHVFDPVPTQHSPALLVGPPVVLTTPQFLRREQQRIPRHGRRQRATDLCQCGCWRAHGMRLRITVPAINIRQSSSHLSFLGFLCAVAQAK